MLLTAILEVRGSNRGMLTIKAVRFHSILLSVEENTRIVLQIMLQKHNLISQQYSH
jgi:hypothetical protein